MAKGVDMGHTKTGPNYGAVGIKKESEETRLLGDLVITNLKAIGETVINCTVDKASSNNESLKLRVQKANSQAIDLFISIHFNSSNGKGFGTEIYTWKGKQLNAAKRVLANMESVGFKNRGIKDGSNLYVIKNTKCEAMLIEVCFIDNQADVDLYNANINQIALAIAEGITGKKHPGSNNSSNDVMDKIGVVTGNGVHARLDDNLDAKILGKFNKGDQVKLYRLEGEWYHCYSQFATNRMYIHKNYIKVI